MNTLKNDDKSTATGVDPGGATPGGPLHSNARPNPQADEGRSFQPDPDDQRGQTGSKEDRIDTDGDGRTRDPKDTRPTDQGGRGDPVQR